MIKPHEIPTKSDLSTGPVLSGLPTPDVSSPYFSMKTFVIVSPFRNFMTLLRPSIVRPKTA